MTDSALYYSVGALLYCPANNTKIAGSIINNKYGEHYSLSLCLEDTISDGFVTEAEEILISSLNTIFTALDTRSFYLPKIFIRVRNPEQMLRLYHNLGKLMSIVFGFIVPKFSPENADSYIEALTKINDFSSTPVYMMPIYESASIVDLRSRIDTLYALKDKLSPVEELILNIRVGGNDLCHIFGFRRHSDQSIHSIKPISDIFSDIITVYGTEYVVSGPVWEYFDGPDWDSGLRREIQEDKLCGFIGKTAIHPNQIAVINNEYAVDRDDYEAAKAILNWDENNSNLVASDPKKERMNEYNTHHNWAKKIMYLAQCYGIR